MGMFQAGACLDSVVLEDGDVLDPGVTAQLVISGLKSSQHGCNLIVVEQSEGARMVRSLDNDFVKSKTIDGAFGTVDSSHRLLIVQECSKLIGHNSHLPHISTRGDA